MTEMADVSSIESDWVPVHLATLRVDTVMDFDLFFKPAANQPFVLYSERNIPFTENTWDRLEESNVRTLYVRATERLKYAHYMQGSLPAIIADASIPPDEKSEIVYASATGTMEGVIDNPESRQGVKLGKEIVKHSVAFMLSDDKVFGNLLETLSTDYEVYTHSVNVVTYTIALARHARFGDAATLREISTGALLHDIGKNMVDPKILKKPGALSPEQWEEMKRHPGLGHEILSATGNFGEIALDIIRHHHEKLPGSGYPDGLSGDEISTFVRMVTITDIFDALTTNRPFQKAQSTFDALSTMTSQISDDLDPVLFKRFVDLMGNPEGSG